jgi:hypothetical protein
MSKKVYCKNCKYSEFGFISKDVRYPASGPICRHKFNLKKIKDTYYEEIYEYIDYPYNLNKNNDCKNFVSIIL